MRLWESWVVLVRFGAIWDRFEGFLGISIGGCGYVLMIMADIEVNSHGAAMATARQPSLLGASRFPAMLRSFPPN